MTGKSYLLLGSPLRVTNPRYSGEVFICVKTKKTMRLRGEIYKEKRKESFADEVGLGQWI